MTSNIPQASATIIPFPIKRRMSAGGFREELKPAAELSPRVSDVACGSWYHEEAIQEARLVQKH
jgi:hypothetical protein